MTRMGRIAAVASGAVAVGVLALVFRTLNTAGVFTDVTPGFAGSCRTITGVTGAEDIEIDTKAGLAFISATDRRAPKGRPSPQDGLYILELAHPEKGATKISGTPRDFHPHGIGLYRGTDGTLTLMAVNHRAAGGSSIDIFAVDESMTGGDTPTAALSERASIQSSLLFSPNAVAAVGPDRFYATNDHGSHTALGQSLETWLALPRANVVYYDGAVPRIVAEGLRFANGIAASPDFSKLYVAETLGRHVLTFRVQRGTGALALENETALPAGLDNIRVDAGGNLWVAGHPKLFALLTYGKDATRPSPSEIFELKTVGGIPGTPRAVYTDPGSGIGASSAGAYADGTLLIGSVFDPKILDCRMR